MCGQGKECRMLPAQVGYAIIMAIEAKSAPGRISVLRSHEAKEHMNCPHCGTYNPEDREVCWRCDKPLPKPKPQKKKDPQKSARIWLYVAIAVFLVITILQTCGFSLPFGPQSPAEQGPSGYLGPRAPIAHLVDRAWGGGAGARG